MDEPQTTPAGPPHPGAPLENHGEPLERLPRFSDSYGLVLLLLVGSFFASAIVGDSHYGRGLTLMILAATTWLALRASQVTRRWLRLAMALIPVVTLVAVVTSVFGDESTAKVVTATLTALLVLVAPVAIARRLTRHPTVSVNTFYGAICIYLLIAMFFAAAFAFMAAATAQAFFSQVQPPNLASTVDYLYFSLTTITTVGYGDLTAHNDVGRMMAVSEAVLGQLYLITVVALVVQNLSAARQRRLRQ